MFLRRLISAVIDAIDAALLCIIFGWLFYKTSSSESLDFFTSVLIVAFIDFYVFLRGYVGLYDLYHKIIGIFSKTFTKNVTKQPTFMNPYYPRSLGMGLAGIYIIKDNKEPTAENVISWRRWGLIITVLTCGIAYIVMFFRKDRATLYDHLFAISVVDKAAYEKHVKCVDFMLEESISGIVERPPIIKKDKK